MRGYGEPRRHEHHEAGHRRCGRLPAGWVLLNASGITTTIPEICNDGVDNDLDGLVDAADPDCAPTPTPEICNDGVDNDLDGLVDPYDPDCAPPTPTDEVCDDGVDNDLDGLVDAYDPDCKEPEVELPNLTINDVKVKEDAGVAKFTVTLSTPYHEGVQATFATTDGTAKAGKDYTATTKTVTFAPGQSSAVIEVPILNDKYFECKETFKIGLTNLVGAHAVDGKGVGTIIDNDFWAPAPLSKISINDAAVKEGNWGTKTMTFTVSLNHPSTKAVTVKYATVNGFATSPKDFTAKSGTVTFAPGEKSKTVTITIKGDHWKEANEKFWVKLSHPSKAIVTDAVGVGTILNDD